MSCCAKCGSGHTVGMESASLCTSCGEAAIAGASFSLPLIAALTVLAVLCLFGVRKAAAALRTPEAAAQPA